MRACVCARNGEMGEVCILDFYSGEGSIRSYATASNLYSSHWYRHTNNLLTNNHHTFLTTALVIIALIIALIIPDRCTYQGNGVVTALYCVWHRNMRR